MDFNKLQGRQKKKEESNIKKVDAIAKDKGFESRENKAGRPRSERTQQIHARIKPEVFFEMQTERENKGQNWGAFIESLWLDYQAQNRLK